MPGPPTHVIVISPLAQVADCTTVLGLTPTASICTLSDTPVRPVTHRAVSGGFTTAQKLIIDAHMASPHPSLTGVVCRYWLISKPNPYQGILAELGLTTDPGSAEE